MKANPPFAQPTVSVLMSVYNGARWLKECIDSVIKQTFTNLEFIIINDGSQDISLDIMKIYASRDKRIRIINKQNSGLANSLNLGIAVARGTWIARIDADDLWEPDRLFEQLAVTKRWPDLVLVGSGTKEIDNEGKVKKLHLYPRRHKQLCRRLKFPNKSFFPHSSAFMRAEVVRRLGGYRPRLKRAQDYDLWLRFSEVGKLFCVKKHLVLIRRHPEQVTHENGGLRQKIDSRAALTSYFLRRQGQADPIAEMTSDHEFGKFWHFVEKKIHHYELLKYHRFIKDIKNCLNEARPSKWLAAIKIILSSPNYLSRYLEESFFGERLAIKLAKEWVKKSNKCAA